MKRILIIDDDVVLSGLLKDHLSGQGFEVTSCARADEGFAKATTTEPHLIMLDLMLPDATGYQVCGKLRETPQTRAIPILMMSSSARHPNQQAIGRMMGAS